MAEEDNKLSKYKETAYIPKPPDGKPYFNDGREVGLLHFIYSLPEIDQIRGEPVKVLAAIDKYATTKCYLMNIGPDKGPTVCDLIAGKKPEVMVELGGYVGYSAVLFGDAVRKAGGKRYVSIEMNPEFAAVIISLVDLAGLSDIVKVVVGASDQALVRLHAEKVLTNIDLLFLDHIKPAYTNDLKLCETLKLVRPGSVLAADNVIYPGNPEYLEYVRSSVEQKRERYKEGNGNPNLVYESKMIKGWEPSGEPDAVEITHCVAEQ